MDIFAGMISNFRFRNILQTIRPGFRGRYFLPIATFVYILRN